MEKVDKAIEILQAFKDGKSIEFLNVDTDEGWKPFVGDEQSLISILNVFEWRMSKKPNYLPYNNAQEFLKASKEHGPYIKYPYNELNEVMFFTTPQRVYAWGVVWTTYLDSRSYWEDLINFYWQDGTPCGILIE